MRKTLHLVVVSIISVLLASCASTYKAIKPEKLSYNNQTVDSSIVFSYEYGMLRMLHNKKYAKKEDKKGIRVVAVKITNNSAQSVVFNQSLKLYSGNTQIVPMDPAFVHQQLKQGVAIYLLYAPLTLSKLTFYESSPTSTLQTKSSIPIGLVLGPGITVGNMAVAGNANQRFLEELVKNNLIGKEIKPGETVYGLVGVRDFGFSPLKVSVTDPGAAKNGF